jgi:hypothetical protein
VFVVSADGCALEVDDAPVVGCADAAGGVPAAPPALDNALVAFDAVDATVAPTEPAEVLAGAAVVATAGRTLADAGREPRSVNAIVAITINAKTPKPKTSTRLNARRARGVSPVGVSPAVVWLVEGSWFIV